MVSSSSKKDAGKSSKPFSNSSDKNEGSTVEKNDKKSIKKEKSASPSPKKGKKQKTKYQEGSSDSDSGDKKSIKKEKSESPSPKKGKKYKTKYPDSPTDSDSHDSGDKLLNSEFIKRDKGKNKDVSMTVDHKSDLEATRQYKAVHEMSDSENSTDNEIHKIVKEHNNSLAEDMSDFSIQSPVKSKGTSSKKSNLKVKNTTGNMTTKQLRFEGEKVNDNKKEMSNSSDSESSMSQSILSGKSQKIKSPKKERKEEETSEAKGQNLKLRYNVPTGFEPSQLTVSKKDVYKEDLDGQELWLIKAPIDFNIEQLSGFDVDLDGCRDFYTKSKDYYEVMGTLDTTNEMASFCPIIPSKEKSTFVLGPKFKGQIHIMQSIEIPPLPPLKNPEPVIHVIPEDLKPRFEPFGSAAPKIMHHDKHHKSDSPVKDVKRKHHHDDEEIDKDHPRTKKVKKEKKKSKNKEYE